ncbi:MAG: hypothetical protein IKW01_02050 [Firmicutes bacterium]|nr:hypothetical protein [Bacillota bacterium]
MDFRCYLREQKELHPAMGPQDAMKMIYQAAFGAEHLLEDQEGARRYLMKEFEETEDAHKLPLIEDISEDMCRVNIGAWKAAGLPPEWLFGIFAASAKRASGGEEKFYEYLQEADEEIARGGLDFDQEEWTAFKEGYLKGGVRAIHHSPAYRQAEKPAYRLAAGCFSRLVPVLEKAASPGTGGRPYVIAIDGRAASGKTTMANWLQAVLGAEIIHMDDFFLPMELRTPERLAQPGGNIHYERFAEEVLPFIKKGGPLTYRRFDCSRMDYDPEPMRLKPSDRIVVEGSYSHHPHLGKYADITVFSTISEELQMERIRSRNGDEMAEVFKSRWIPMEEKYFSEMKIRENAQVII